MKINTLLALVLLSAPIMHGVELASTAAAADEKTQLGHELVQKAYAGDLAAVQDLLRRGADINFQKPASRDFPSFGTDGTEFTPLLAALWLKDFGAPEDMKQNKIAVAKFLIKQGADVNKAIADRNQNERYSPLMVAIDSVISDTDLIKLLLAKGANPNYKTPENDEYPHGIDAVRLALHSMEKRDLAKLIIDESRVKIEPEALAYPLFFALKTGDIPFAQYLIEKGAALTKTARDVGDGDGPETLLHIAAQNGYQDIVRLLIERIKAEKSQVLNALLAGAELVPEAERDEQGGASVPPDVVWMALKPIVESNKIDSRIINAEDAMGRTPLWFALYGKHKSSAIAKMLVDAGGKIRFGRPMTPAERQAFDEEFKGINIEMIP